MDELIQVGAITSLVKLGVDLIKKAAPNDLRTWVLPLAAILLGILFAFLLSVRDGQVMTPSSVAGIIISGVLAAGGAVGLTEVHKRARGDT